MSIAEIFQIIIAKIIYLAKTYYNNKKAFYDDIIDKNNRGDGIFCKEPRMLGEYILKIVFFLLLFSIFWLLVDTMYNLYIYLKLTLFSYIKENPRLIDSPLFIQVKKLYYFNDYFSIDLFFLLFVTTPIFILIKLWILEKAKGEYNHFNYLKVYCFLIMAIGLLYYLMVYKNITALGKRMNYVNNVIYNNINADFINSQKICNYLNKRSDFDYDFIYGKCNDIKSNMSISKLYNYIKTVTNDIQQNIAPMANISIEKFKTLKDKNGKLYKDKIISALFTFQIIKYYIDNDLVDEAKDFFAAYNIIYFNKINVVRQKINPILYLRFDDIMFFTKNYDYNERMAESFGDNKDIYNYIYSEFSRIQNNVQNVVVDIFNIVSYKLISVYAYYFVMFIILVILLIIYIYNN